MNAPTGRKARVSVMERAMSASLLPNSLAIAVSVMTTTKKSNASRVQPRKPAVTAARWSGVAGAAAPCFRGWVIGAGRCAAVRRAATTDRLVSFLLRLIDPMTATIRPFADGDHAEWRRMRLALWPEEATSAHEALEWLGRKDATVLVAQRES